MSIQQKNFNVWFNSKNIIGEALWKYLNSLKAKYEILSKETKGKAIPDLAITIEIMISFIFSGVFDGSCRPGY